MSARQRCKMSPISNSYRSPSLGALTRLQLAFGGYPVTTWSSSLLGCCDPDEVTKASLLTQMMIRTKTTNPHARVFTVIRNSCDVCVSAFYHRIQDADHSLPQSSMHGSRTRSNDSSNKQGRAKRIAIDALFYGRERISGIFFMGQFLDIGAQ